jgi:hypothetical protein
VSASGPDQRDLSVVAEGDGGGNAAPLPSPHFVEEVGAALALEAQRYLAVVEFFRRQGCEPHWRPEPRTVDLDANASPGALFERKER